MSVFSAEQLDSMRATVTSTLTDSCTIAAAKATSFSAGDYTTTPGAQVYSGACRFGALDTDDRVVEAGGEAVSLRTYRLHLPWDTTGIEPNQIVSATTSNDPHIEGARFRVLDVRGMTDPVGRSVIIEEVLG